ncbi:MAG: hypothetical protein LLG01_18380 [Planctomycetaceae bacterium]|nr:hypothetical protein [Planctomycetaceae bacterium]
MPPLFPPATPPGNFSWHSRIGTILRAYRSVCRIVDMDWGYRSDDLPEKRNIVASQLKTFWPGMAAYVSDYHWNIRKR